MKHIVQGIFIIFWVAGWVIAQGFWSTFFAFILPPWGYYLVIEAALKAWGWI